MNSRIFLPPFLCLTYSPSSGVTGGFSICTSIEGGKKGEDRKEGWRNEEREGGTEREGGEGGDGGISRGG